MKQRTCTGCQHFRKTGGATWGRCKAPLPVWIADRAPRIISQPDDPKLAPLCPTWTKATGGPQLTPEALEKLLRRRRFKGRTADAVKLVLLKGYTRAAASRAMGIDQAAVTRMFNKLAKLNICPACGSDYKVGPGNPAPTETPAL